MAQEVRIGAKLHNFGAAVEKVPFAECAVVAEEAGYDSVWLSDHVVLPSEVSSPYPFTDDHLIDWPVDTPFYDAVVSMSTVAAVTHRIEVGMGVLVLAVRHPLVIAKQIASLDALSRGRIVLAVGAGWLAEEYDILGVPFETRGSRLDEWIHLLRDCWTGTPAAFEGKHFRLPEGVLCYPTPAREVPILIGGMSHAARRRAGAIADGWYPLLYRSHDEADVILAGMEQARQAARDAGRDPAGLRMALRREGPTDLVARELPDLVAAGVTDVVVDVDWLDAGSPRRVLGTLRTALGG